MQRSVLSAIELRVSGAGSVDIGVLQRDFPTVAVHVIRGELPNRTELVSRDESKRGEGASHDELPSRDAGQAAESSPLDVDYDAWHSPRFDYWAFDRRVDAAVEAGRALVLHAPSRHATRFACEVLTRAQRRIERRNASSEGERFDRALEAHRALHDVSRPLVRADLDHALDCWQWVLRLERRASEAVQLAALLHDVERLESEADARIEQHAPDYRAYKAEHARRGASRAAAVVRAAGGSEALASEVADLVEASESSGASREVSLLNDADSLSFFALNSPGFADYFGATHTRKKIAYTIARMSARALSELPRIRLRPDVAALVAEVLDAPFRAVEATG